MEKWIGTYNHQQFRFTYYKVPTLSPGYGEICSQRNKPLITLPQESSANCQLFASNATRTHNLRIVRLTP